MGRIKEYKEKKVTAKVKRKKLVLIFMTLFVVKQAFALTLEHEMGTMGYSSSVLPSKEGFLTEKKTKTKNEFFSGITLANRFDLALKNYDWKYPSLKPFFEQLYGKRENTLNFSIAWAGANLSPLMNSYLFQNKGWDCDGTFFDRGDIKELITAFFPWEIGTTWGRTPFYGGKSLDAHEFHEAVHFHLFTGDGLLFYEKKTGFFYPILKVKSSFKELLPQELISYLDREKGPRILPSKFFQGQNREGRKALNIMRFTERSLEIITKNENISFFQLKKKILESPFFSEIFLEFEGLFKKYKTKKKLEEILVKLGHRYFRHALYNNSLRFVKGIRVEKVDTEIILKKPGIFGADEELDKKQKMSYFLFQRKGEKGFNQKVLSLQTVWKKSLWKKINTIEKKKGPFWKDYLKVLRKKVNRPWFLTSLGKKSNYFVMGSSWLTSTSFRPSFLLSVKELANKVDQMAPQWSQWFFDVWDKNELPLERAKGLSAKTFYGLVGRGIALKGLNYLFKRCRHLK